MSMKVKNSFALQSIRTKYLGPTNRRGARVKASAQCGSKTFVWDDSKNVEENHNAAAMAFAESMGWTGDWYSGAAHDGNGNVYVWVTEPMVDGASKGC